MARNYSYKTYKEIKDEKLQKALMLTVLLSFIILVLVYFLPINNSWIVFCLAFPISIGFFKISESISAHLFIKFEKKKEIERRGGGTLLGTAPDRTAFVKAKEQAQAKGKFMIDKYLVGFGLETGEPLWVSDDDMCSHACVFAKTGVGKTLWMESLILQQMARGRASGCTFIDAKRDSGTLSQIILMALMTGRIEDLIVVDPFDPVHSYNFVLTNQRPDVKSRKVLRAGLPPTSDQSVTKHYDRLAYDSISRMVRSLEAIGKAWSINDVAVALSAFQHSYPHLKEMLEKIGAKDALVELGHMASSYRSAKGGLDATKLSDNLRGISSELHAISRSEMGGIFCTPYTDLVLTEAITKGKIIYFMLPRLEEAESAARMVKLFREDLEISIGEITSSQKHNLEDPHLVVIDEGSSTFGPTWANLFELARKGRFSLIFGAQSTGGLTDSQMGLSQAFYERVMANVNLKVMMRVGDNRTAQDVAEWFGKTATTKTSIGSGTSSKKSLASIGTESQSMNISEAQDYIVSPEELKHEMSSEKGLAWYDLGDGRIVKGRAFWVDADIPPSWDSRKHLVSFEKFEREMLNLGEYVDDKIISAENTDSSSRDEEVKDIIEESKAPQEEDGAFKLNLSESKSKARGSVRSYSVNSEAESTQNTEEDTPNTKKKNSKGKFPSGKMGIRKDK